MCHFLELFLSVSFHFYISLLPSPSQDFSQVSEVGCFIFCPFIHWVFILVNSLYVNLPTSLKTYHSELPPKINPSKACLYGIPYKKFSGDHFKYAEFVSLNQDIENYPNYPYIVGDSCCFPFQISLSLVSTELQSLGR